MCGAKMIWNQKPIKTSFLILLAIFLLPFGCRNSPVPKATPAPISKSSGHPELARLIETIRVEEGLPALAAAVIINGKIDSVAVTGTREQGTRNWVTRDDKLLIGSCTKAFTATLAAILVEEGVIEFNTTIQDVFPLLSMKKEYENITLGQLLSHRAGLPKNYKGGETTWLIDYEFDISRGSSPRELRLQHLENTVKQNLIARPGEKVYYSNAGYLVAGAMLEKRTGRTFEQLLEEKVFKPLQIDSAGYGLPFVLEPGIHPWGHYFDTHRGLFVKYKSDHPGFMAPTGYMHLTIEDWTKFIIFHVTSRPQLVNSKTLKKLHTLEDQAKWDINIDLGLNYAYGWFTKKASDGHHLIWHGGRGFNINAQVVADLDSKNAVVVISTGEVPHIHPATLLLHITRKIKDHFKNKSDLPSII